MKNLFLGLDLDGTVYDSLQLLYDFNVKVFTELGIKEPSVQEFRKAFRSHGWEAMYSKLGVPREFYKTFYSKYITEYKNLPLPPIIPGAPRVLEEVFSMVPKDSIFVITSESEEKVAEKFSRDNINGIGSMFTSQYNKLVAMKKITSQNNGIIIYIGDLISDGEACREAGISFGAITHEYSFNTPEQLKRYVSENTHAIEIPSLEQLPKILKGF